VVGSEDSMNPRSDSDVGNDVSSIPSPFSTRNLSYAESAVSTGRIFSYYLG
jgi:hypothetical protein